MPSRRTALFMKYWSHSIAMNEVPFNDFYSGLYTSLGFNGKVLRLDLDTSGVSGMPAGHMAVHYHKAHGTIRLDKFKLLFDGNKVASGDFDGFNTHLKHPGDVDGLEHPDAINLWNGHAQITLVGNTQNDQLFGTLRDDVLRGHGGNDAFFGSFGRDYADGGGGDDQLLMGPGHDRAFGGGGKDFISTGAGDRDTADGGAGNDVIDAGGGRNRIDGGGGRDIFGFDTALPSIGSKWTTHAKTIVRDFDGSEDVLIFHGLPAGALPTTGNDAASTLGDLNPDDIPGLDWHETKHGALVIEVGNYKVVLRHTKGSDVQLDKLAFSHQTGKEFAQSFNDDGGMDSIGTTLHGGIDDIIVDHSGDGAVVHTPDAGMFDTYEPPAGAPSYFDHL